MRTFLSLLAVVSVALGAVIRRDDGADSGLVKLESFNESSTLANYEVLFYEDQNFKGAGWGMVPIPNQPSSPETGGQFCYFVDPGRVSSLKLVKQRNDRRFSCRFYRTLDACQHNIPALTLDYPAERASLGPELDNQINSALCWWTSPAQEKYTARHEVVDLAPNTRPQQGGDTKGLRLVNVFTDPDFRGYYIWYHYAYMLAGSCMNFMNSETSPKWSSLRLNAAAIIYHCRFYEPLHCREDGTTFYFDIQQIGGGASVHDLRLTKDNKGKPWDNRLKSMKCLPGGWSEQLEENSGMTAYPVSVD
ncbi:hypothetical protein P171DRAFT_109719 [Karstenula rhodostoma CBS 690.94]|uniref:AA1-like domain-containing protein n=1 Tax=Karstenula rhodostoma CBS 690.94 TaxID=1392251 RepID=A0A9P4U7E0_9PLEO|nr:hypothetical protein P171DRAFT_109719 [Karstenula rhodostoma CBS 690.94]